MKIKTLLPLLTLALLLSACATGTPEAIPTIVLDNRVDNSPRQSSSETIIASAIVVPAQEANLAFASGGNIKIINVSVGEEVKEGQILAELDNKTVLLEIERAERALRELASPAQISAAEETLAKAQENLEDAQNKVDGLVYPRASETIIDNTKAELDLAAKDLTVASKGYKDVENLEDGNAKKAGALLAMTNAQLRLNGLQASYNWYTGTPSETDVSIAEAQLGTAQAQIQEAEWHLAALNGEEIPPSAFGAKLTQIQEAQNNLEIAKNHLDQSRLIAPISGIVSEINLIAGEYATPGKMLIIISSTTFQIETTDLSERDISKIKVGQSALVYIEALDLEIEGHISAISPLANTLGGDIVYPTTIQLEEIPASLRWGMSATVEIITD